METGCGVVRHRNARLFWAAIVGLFRSTHFSNHIYNGIRQLRIRAFELSATAYLLKPIDGEKLQAAIEKSRELLDLQNYKQQLETLQANYENTDSKPQRLAIPVGNGYQFVAPNDILWLKAEGSYCHIALTNERKLLVSKRLGAIYDLLEHARLFRCGRSYVVNLDYVEKFERNDGGVLTMQGGEQITLPKDLRASFLEKLSGQAAK